MQDTLAALLITKPIINNFGEIFGPKLVSWGKVFLLRRRRDSENDTNKLTQVETESEKPEYSSSFDDYLEMFIQVRRRFPSFQLLMTFVTPKIIKRIE